MPWSAKQVRASKTLTVSSGQTQPKRNGNRNPHQQDPCKMLLPSFLFSGLSKVFREQRFLSMLIPFDRKWNPKVFSGVCGVASWDLCLYGADRSSMAAHCPLAKQVLKWVHRHFYSSQMVNPMDHLLCTVIGTDIQETIQLQKKKHHPSMEKQTIQKPWFLVGGFNLGKI